MYGALDPQRDVRTSLEKTIGANPMQRVDYGYDTINQLTGEVLSQGGTPLQSKSFAYDAIGNRTTTGSVTSSDTVSSTYTANRLNQITAHNSSWGGGANTLTSALQYDQGGNLTKWTSTGTGSATSAHTEYVYDDLDRLTSVVKKNPTSSANESKTEFLYDGYSRLRVSKEYTWNGAAWVLTANSEKHRIYDGMDMVQERDENNAVLATYTRDGNIGGILSKRDDNGDDYFFHYDGSGNVIVLTDENEDSVAEYAYDAYGNLLSSSGTQANSNNYRYSTKEHFGSIGLYNYGYRFYNPGLGRWINRDPLEENGGINLYMSFANSPSNLIDPYGLIPSDPPMAAYSDGNGGWVLPYHSSDPYPAPNQPEGFLSDEMEDQLLNRGSDLIWFCINGLWQMRRAGGTGASNARSKNKAPTSGQPPRSVSRNRRPDGSSSTTYYNDKGQQAYRKDYGQQSGHGSPPNRIPPGGPHEHRYRYNDKGQPIGKDYRELRRGQPGPQHGPWIPD